MSNSDVQVVVADTDTARRFHYQLRYQVFCLETGFEDASKYPDGLEKDEFDDRSEHFIVRSKSSGEWLATARLILPGEGALPIERYCKVSRNCPPFAETAELSRLLIPTHIRRRNRGGKMVRTPGSARRSPSLVAYQDRQQTKKILVELIRSMAAYGLERNIPGAAFFITRALARILVQMGIGLRVIGNPCRHRGIRFPYISSAAEVYATLSRLGGHDCNEPVQRQQYKLFSELPDATMNPKIMGQCFIERSGTWQ